MQEVEQRRERLPRVGVRASSVTAALILSFSRREKGLKACRNAHYLPFFPVSFEMKQSRAREIRHTIAKVERIATVVKNAASHGQAGFK